MLEGSVWLDFYAVQHAIMVSSLHALGQPDHATTAALRDPTSQLISFAQQTRLAPTYRITMNVALQLAFISGIANDLRVGTRHHSPSAQPSELPVQPHPNPTLTDLEQLFGQLPPDGPQQPDIFSDMFSMGYAQDAGNQWDFFTFGDIAHGALGGQ
jgi:hypothetical protein